MTDAIITRVNGPVVEVETEAGLAMLELVEVGPQRLPGEVIALEGPGATVQVYEYTGGLRPGDEVMATGGPLAVDLGPGLLGGVFDGILRPLRSAGAWIEPGSTRRGSTEGRTWTFTPSTRSGEQLSEGATLGIVVESPAIDHHLMLPPGAAGRVDWIVPAGEIHPGDTVARVGGGELGLTQRWPVRRPRPTRARLAGGRPLVTGQRVLDLLFPIARGSTAAIPGGFGTGKTVALQQIAKWCDASVIVYVGCGERGNELADVLEDFEALEDPRTGRPLLDRTVLIANTSNMPVMAREASIYTGVTVAEYYRDMGYDAVVIADSTSRWAEALRELASRTNELPAEEGYPAGLSSALAAFYERAGRVQTLGGASASVTILGAVSPPGGDLTEPVTSHTRRFVRAVWSLDRDLAYARHYPAVSWRDSSARDVDQLASWQAENGDPDWVNGAGARSGCSPTPTGSSRSRSSSALTRCPVRNASRCAPRACCARPCCSRAPSSTTISSAHRPSSARCWRSCSRSTSASPACSSGASRPRSSRRSTCPTRCALATTRRPTAPTRSSRSNGS